MARKKSRKRNPVARSLRVLGRRVVSSKKVYERKRSTVYLEDGTQDTTLPGKYIKIPGVTWIP